MPEEAVLLFIFAFNIGYRCLTVRTPVDDSFAVIDKTLVVKVDEYLLYSL